MEEFSELVGQTLESVEVSDDKELITFVTVDGKVYTQYHNQDCCEGVSVEDIAGELDDLVGSPILKASEDSNRDENPEGVTVPDYQDSFTWTFYNIATAKGHVTIRWYGESNGYYSEDVSFRLNN